jgi:hypothetical protein
MTALSDSRSDLFRNAGSPFGEINSVETISRNVAPMESKTPGVE